MNKSVNNYSVLNYSGEPAISYMRYLANCPLTRTSRNMLKGVTDLSEYGNALGSWAPGFVTRDSRIFTDWLVTEAHGAVSHRTFGRNGGLM